MRTFTQKLAFLLMTLLCCVAHDAVVLCSYATSGKGSDLR